MMTARSYAQTVDHIPNGRDGSQIVIAGYVFPPSRLLEIKRFNFGKQSYFWPAFAGENPKTPSRSLLLAGSEARCRNHEYLDYM